jgi:hypothetical protein
MSTSVVSVVASSRMISCFRWSVMDVGRLLFAANVRSVSGELPEYDRRGASCAPYAHTINKHSSLCPVAVVVTGHRGSVFVCVGVGC